MTFLDGGGGRRIAYRRLEGKGPGVVFCSGFKSDMTGNKAMFLESLCRERGRAFLRFDYTGHGESSGAFEEGTIGQWIGDAVEAFDALTQGPQVVVGSSMGGWIALKLALARPERVHGLVGLASAPDFTEKLVWDAFTPSQKDEMARTGKVMIPDCYGAEPYAITQRLIEEGRDHLMLDAPIAIDCPVRLIHGTADADVPYAFSLKIMDRVRSTDVRVELLKGSGHRLSEPHELAVLAGAVLGIGD